MVQLATRDQREIDMVDRVVADLHPGGRHRPELVAGQLIGSPESAGDDVEGGDEAKTLQDRVGLGEPIRVPVVERHDERPRRRLGTGREVRGQGRGVDRSPPGVRQRGHLGSEQARRDDELAQRSAGEGGIDDPVVHEDRHPERRVGASR